MSMQEHPQLPSVEEALESERTFQLDELGRLEVSDDSLHNAEAEILGDLHRIWPDAGRAELLNAARDVAAFYRQTLETGTINYAEARELGRRTASELRGYATAG